MKQKVYDYLCRIPRGKVVTYSQIASHLGNPRLARVVGNILHQNPDGKRIPCYKVVNREGKLSVSYAFGGAEVQARRLIVEGITVTNGKVDLSKYQYIEENKS